MKRCPQCSFLYLDSDQFCDLDQTPLLDDDFGTDAGVIEPTQTAEKPAPSGVVRRRKLNLKTLVATVIAGLVIGLTVLITYQKMRPTLQARQAPAISQTQASQTARVSQVAQQAANEAQAELAKQQSESPDVAPKDTAPSAEPPTSTTAKPTPNTRADSGRVRVNSNPVSTGDVSTPGRGPVTIRLADGTTLEADEVWRTKAGIWYRRKGIVTFIKPNRVRSMNH